MNKNRSPLHLVFSQQTEQLPPAFADQFLLSPADPHTIFLKGAMSKVYFPPLLTPLFWLMGKFGMLIPSQGKNIPTEVILKCEFDENNNVIHSYNRKLFFKHPYEFNTIFSFDEKYQQPAEALGPFGILYMVWKTEYFPPYDFQFETMATAIKIGSLKIWLPKWLWKMLGTTKFTQTTSAEKPNHTQITLNIETPFAKKFFGYRGEFEVIRVKK